jgi:hypothetical protein
VKRLMVSIKRSKQLKNRYEVIDEDTSILWVKKNGKEIKTLISTKYIDTIMNFNWFIMGQTATQQGYVGFSRRIKGRTIYYKLHRLILEVEDEKVFVDHINRDRFDNRKCNLRIATRSENSRNMSKQKLTKHKYKGIRITNSGKFECTIFVNGKPIYLGCFLTELEAVKVYDENAALYHGEFAATNVGLGLITEEKLRSVKLNKHSAHKRKNVWYSNYAGVSREKNSNKNPWRAYITFKGKHIRLGGFKTEEEAALAYDKKARELFGSVAKLNFPDIIKKETKE